MKYMDRYIYIYAQDKQKKKSAYCLVVFKLLNHLTLSTLFNIHTFGGVRGGRGNQQVLLLSSTVVGGSVLGRRSL